MPHVYRQKHLDDDATVW